MKERVQKVLARWGIASRRQAEQAILDGRVRLNGEIAQLGQKVDLSRDRLQFDGRTIRKRDRPDSVYLLLHKPLGVVSTCRDPQGRKTALDLLPPELRRGQGIHPVGRLDADSTGALLLSNDGAWTQAIAHPRAHLPKTYEVWVQGSPTEETLQQWRQGVMLSGKPTLPARIEVLTSRPGRTLLQIVLDEGRNRQIRKVASDLGHEVLKLHRTAIGPIQLQPTHGRMLPPGAFRFLKSFEIKCFKSSSTST